MGDETAAATHLRDDQPSGTAAIETFRTRACDPLERRGELRLAQCIAGLEPTEVTVEVGAPCKLGPLLGEQPCELGFDRESLAREPDRGRDETLPGQGAVALVRGPEAGDCAGHARGERTDEARIRDRLARGVEVHVARGAGGCGFAEIQELLLAVEVHGHETAAAEIARFREGDRKHEGGGDGRIDGIAALQKDAFGDFGAVAVGCGDCSGTGDCSGAGDCSARCDHEQQADEKGRTYPSS